MLREKSIPLAATNGLMRLQAGVATWARLLAGLARRKPAGALSALALTLFIFATIAAPMIATHDPVATDTPNRLQSPSLDHFLGTDDIGRDVWSRVVFGARISVTVAFTGTALALALSTVIALISGYFGGTVDVAIQRFVDAFNALPGLLVLLSVLTVLSPSVLNLVLVLGFIFGIRESRVVRAGVLSVKSKAYVEAASVLGASSRRIIVFHVLPNITSVVVIVGSLMVGRLIIAEASAGFLGVGVPPPTPTWGQMLSGSGRVFMTQAPWMALAPGVAISVAVLAFNMLGDAIRDLLDPRLRNI